MALLIFDLDGTLIDSRLDLAHAVNATRKHLNRDDISHELIYSYVGNGAPVLIQRAMGPGASEAEVETALEFFLDYYREHAVDYTVLYPGVFESLTQLHAAGVTLALLTNKPVGITNFILRHFGISDMMFRVYGGNSFPEKKPDPVGIRTIQAEAAAAGGIADTETWMVGDSIVDIQTARNAGVRSCGVTYGFQPETFALLPPDVVVDRLEEFADRFLSR